MAGRCEGCDLSAVAEVTRGFLPPQNAEDPCPRDPQTRVPHVKVHMAFPTPVQGSRLAGPRWPVGGILVEPFGAVFIPKGPQANRRKARPSR